VTYRIPRRALLGSAAAAGLGAAVGLGACGPNSSGAGSGPASITVSNWDGGINEQTVAAFNKVHPDIKVKVLLFPDDYAQKITTMVTGRKAPDVMLLFEETFFKFAAEKVIEPLDSYMSKQSKFTADDFIPAVRDLIKQTGGTTYGLPWCYATELLFYNKDLFDAAKLSYPDENWTWDDFRQAALKLTR